MAALDACDQHDATDDDEAEQDLEWLDAAAGEERLGEGGEERDGGEAGEADGDVGELDGAEEAEPVQADDHADPDHDGGFPFARPDLVFPDKRDPCEGRERGEDGSPGNQHGSANARKPSDDRGEGEQEDEEVKLEEGADPRMMVRVTDLSIRMMHLRIVSVRGGGAGLDAA